MRKVARRHLPSAAGTTRTGKIGWTRSCVSWKKLQTPGRRRLRRSSRDKLRHRCTSNRQTETPRMRAPYRSSYALRAAGQRGQAMLLSVLLLGVGVSAIVFSFVTPAKTAIESDKKTAAALKQARDALIGRAAADQTIPGSLPCPDTDDDGSAELFAGNQCPAYLGRLPWRTL